MRGSLEKAKTRKMYHPYNIFLFQNNYENISQGKWGDLYQLQQKWKGFEHS